MATDSRLKLLNSIQKSPIFVQKSLNKETQRLHQFDQSQLAKLNRVTKKRCSQTHETQVPITNESREKGRTEERVHGRVSIGDGTRMVAWSRYFRLVGHPRGRQRAMRYYFGERRTAKRDETKRNGKPCTGRARHTNWSRKTSRSPSWSLGTGRFVSLHRVRRSIRFRSVPSSSTETAALMGLESLLRVLSFAPARTWTLVSLLRPRFSPSFNHELPRSLPLIRFQGEGSSYKRWDLRGGPEPG